MINAELLAKIKAEIERHLNSATEHQNANPDMPKYRWYLYEGEKELCTDLLGYIDDTLESETNKDEKVPNRIYLGSKYEFIRRDIILKEIEGLKKNNEVSDDSEYAPYELDVACGYDMACDNILSFLKPFAEVDKHPKNILAPSKECEPGLREPLESEKPVPADLEEAADEMAIIAFPEKKSYSTVIDRVVDYNAVDRKNYRDGIVAGAKWQADHTPLPEDTVLFQKGVEEGKRLMMEEAVEGYVNYYEDSGGILMAEAQVGCPYHNGDKVRIIICKKED